ncbi:MAG: uracil-DNA glycosylase [Candidatus Melainabacteria bacterium]|nr:uracil-DNA glycosylase [Candidatus Melainabacteria bacterium]
MMNKLLQLQKQVTLCKKCPRLVKYLNQIKEKYSTYWCKPVPSFGDHDAEILILGLAPGRFGSNRTGRMFTGDSSGDFMYKILHEVGLCNKPVGAGFNPALIHANDGLILKNCYITAVGRCAPPQNKPTPKELENCFPYFEEEIKLLKNVKVIIALGKIAFDGYLKWLFSAGVCHWHVLPRKKDFKFSHGAIYKSKDLPHTLIASYHPSRQNTQTGKLTPVMFRQIFREAVEYCSL